MIRKKLRFNIILILMGAFLSTKVSAQEISVQGGFLKDSIRIGDIVPYYLTSRYPSHLTMLFPDSSYSFAPFEFSKKKFFTTRTANGESFDSVVYELTTFEIDVIQKLQLPVFSVTPRDCTRFIPQWDSVRLIELVKTPPPDSVQAENLPLKTNTSYEQVPYLINYPLVLIFLGGLLLIVIIIWIAFGKGIRKYFQLKRLTRNHKKFEETFARSIEEIKVSFSPRKTESALTLWKNYLEYLEKKPFTKLTTQETIRMENDEQMGINLRNLDRAIYGHDTSVTQPLEALSHIAQQRFEKKLDEVKHG